MGMSKKFSDNFPETTCIIMISEYNIKCSSVALHTLFSARAKKTVRRCAYGYFKYFHECQDY